MCGKEVVSPNSAEGNLPQKQWWWCSALNLWLSSDPWNLNHNELLIYDQDCCYSIQGRVRGGGAQCSVRAETLQFAYVCNNMFSYFLKSQPFEVGIEVFQICAQTTDRVAEWSKTANSQSSVGNVSLRPRLYNHIKLHDTVHGIVIFMPQARFEPGT